jgi:hypothetical protein
MEDVRQKLADQALKEPATCPSICLHSRLHAIMEVIRRAVSDQVNILTVFMIRTGLTFTKQWIHGDRTPTTATVFRILLDITNNNPISPTNRIMANILKVKEDTSTEMACESLCHRHHRTHNT